MYVFGFLFRYYFCVAIHLFIVMLYTISPQIDLYFNVLFETLLLNVKMQALAKFHVIFWEEGEKTCYIPITGGPQSCTFIK